MVKNHCLLFAPSLRCVAYSLYYAMKWAAKRFTELLAYEMRSRSVPKAIALLSMCSRNQCARSL
ncbi:hypothetical protein NDA03_20415 [Trichocoleus sp. Lan]